MDCSKTIDYLKELERMCNTYTESNAPRMSLIAMIAGTNLWRNEHEPKQSNRAW